MCAYPNEQSDVFVFERQPSVVEMSVLVSKTYVTDTIFHDDHRANDISVSTVLSCTHALITLTTQLITTSLIIRSCMSDWTVPFHWIVSCQHRHGPAVLLGGTMFTMKLRVGTTATTRIEQVSRFFHP